MIPPTLDILAQAEAVYRYRPFLTPSPLFFGDGWVWLLVPLALAIAIVYKSVRCDSMRRVPREAGVLFLVIIVVMVLAGAALAGLTHLLEIR